MEGTETVALEESALDTDLNEGQGNEGDGGEGEGQGTEKQEAGKDGQQTEQEKQDGRNRPDSARKALKWLQDQANEHSPVVKQLNNELGRARAYQQVYPTVQDARDTKALIDTVGGAEGVATLQQSHATMERIDAMVEAGDPSIVEDMFKQSPEGMVKLFGPIMDQVAKLNPQAFDEVMTPQAVQFMDKQGLTGALNGLIDAFQKDDKDGMKTILSRIANWYGGLKKGAAERGTSKPDPEREKFEREKTEHNARVEKEDGGKATSAANLYAGTVIDKTIAPDLKKLNLSKEAVEELRQDIWREVQRQRNADENYKPAIAQKWKGKDRITEATKYMNQQTDLRVKKVADKIIATRYGHLLKGKSATTAPGGAKPTDLGAKKNGGGTTQAGYIKLAAKPDRSEFDYGSGKTTPDDVLSRRATLKDGRKVSW